ncbi:exonuclease [Mycobacterium phage Larva]|uniref:Exonuclease n=1 Tax=Mycobacterium phage Larva TaxID=2922990 RepID=G1FMV8_9CAUD|nr:exonuclease [Mycobacterium phage Larva]AEL19704.1 hypothetical protein LARVA_56 [Mycobacterium phage Larva]
MTNGTAAFLGLTPDAPERDRPPTDEQRINTDLLNDLKAVLRRHYFNTPRNMQKALGPSEVGHPCARRIAGGLLQLERVNPEGDPLPSWVGTAGHSRFELAIEEENARLIRQAQEFPGTRCTVHDGVPIGRWFSERRVTVREGLSGTCDLFDTWTGTVVDLKFPGTTKFAEYKKRGPSTVYRSQAHLYGRGYRNQGFDVKRVAIWFLPRGGQLSASFAWSEPYSDEIVDGVLAKLDQIAIAMDELRIDGHPERINLFPTVSDDCQYCPFFTPRAGHPAVHACRGGVS